MNAELNAKFEKALADEAYAKELFTLDTPEKIRAKLAEKDINLSADEVSDLVSAVIDATEERDGTELDESALDAVAGGIVIPPLLRAAAMIVTVGGVSICWKRK